MKRTFKHLLVLGLAGTLTAAAATAVNAAEDAKKTTVVAPTPQALIGKVLSVDRIRKTVIVEIQGKIFAFKLSPQLSLVLNGQHVSLESLVPGQEVSLIARRSADGRFEIVSLAIDSSTAQTQTAGVSARGKKKSDGSTAAQNYNPFINSPASFRSEPNPANTSGAVISPNK